ncbi:MAG TPA: VOC family protein, partial [Marmoricola sp.]|nr:VOC family protein [Marmoricola sp.]
MASRLDALCFDANDPDGLARFWSGVLGWEP